MANLPHDPQPTPLPAPGHDTRNACRPEPSRRRRIPAPVRSLGVGRNGCVVDPKSGHGFTSDHPQVSSLDTKTLKLIKTIDVKAARADGIYLGGRCHSNL